LIVQAGAVSKFGHHRHRRRRFAAGEQSHRAGFEDVTVLDLSVRH
jgi:hypothetical protein